ncbi:hypothetical protein ACJX0J_039703, partial [Zea mays]
TCPQILYICTTNHVRVIFFASASLALDEGWLGYFLVIIRKLAGVSIDLNINIDYNVKFWHFLLAATEITKFDEILNHYFVPIGSMSVSDIWKRIQTEMLRHITVVFLLSLSIHHQNKKHSVNDFFIDVFSTVDKKLLCRSCAATLRLHPFMPSRINIHGGLKNNTLFFKNKLIDDKQRYYYFILKYSIEGALLTSSNVFEEILFLFYVSFRKWVKEIWTKTN